MEQVTIATSQRVYTKEIKNAIPRKDFLALCALFNKFLMKKLLDGYHFYFPCGLFTGKIVGYKMKPVFNNKGKIKKGVPINWGATKKLWKDDPESKKENKIVYITNTNTGGIIYKFYIHNRGRDTKCHPMNPYKFKLAKINRKLLYEKITIDKKEYICNM